MKENNNDKDFLKSKIDQLYEQYGTKVWLSKKIGKRVSFVYAKGTGFEIPPVKIYENNTYIVFLESDNEIIIEKAKTFFE